MGFPHWAGRPSLMAGPVGEVPPGGPVGIAGADLQGLRPVLAVAEGQRVAAGELLFSDRKRPWIAAVAPVAGVVRRLEPGPRRGISMLEIEPEGEAARAFPTDAAGDREGLVALMTAAGLWTGLRSRPFGRIPDPAGHPEALFVTVTEGQAGAPDPEALLPGFDTWFHRGLAALPALGPLHLCHPPGLSPPVLPGVRATAFRAGLPSAHIHALHPVAHGGMVWQIHWQEVVALGHLLETGRIWPQRIVALSGPAAARPGLIAAPIGARLHDIAAGRLRDMPLRLLAGGAEGVQMPFLRPGIRRIAAVPHREAARPGLFGRLTAPRRAALIPNRWDEALAPRGVLPVPLLRALAAGDAAAARDLGALGLVEEDLAAMGARMGGPDYPALLRQTLDELEATA